MIKQIITATYDAVLSSLGPDGRILSIQAQRNSESIMNAIRSLHKKIADTLAEWHNSKCVFNSDLYDAYLDKYQQNMYRWFFTVNRDGEKYRLEDVIICNDELSNELEHFLNYNWRKQLREKLDVSEKEYPCIVNSFCNISTSFSMSQSIRKMEKTLRTQLKDNPKDQNYLESIRKKLINTPFQNCLFISGCFGCGKTRISFELARHVKEYPGKFGDTVFLFISSNMSADIRSNIVSEFTKLFSRTCSIDQYLDAFSEDLKLVIVLDDIQRYFQKGIDFSAIINLVVEYSRSYVKWIITSQPGYNWDPYKLYDSFYEEYAYPWGPKMDEYLIDKWFALDLWHRSNDTPGMMIDQALSISQWEWKGKVSTTNYYTPLFANILISYHMTHENESIFAKKNLLFPDFCAVFYSILSGNPNNLERDVKRLVRIFLELRKLEFPLEDDTPQDACDHLINSGLLLKKISPETDDTIFEGTPDIVWTYKLARSLQENWLDHEFRFRQGINDAEWSDNKDLFQNVMSLIIQIAHSKVNDSSEDILKSNWNHLLKWGYCQAVIDSGFNCEPSLRNALIEMLLNHKAIWKKHFDAIMHLCAFGKVENDLLIRVITHSVQNFPSQMVKHEFLFAYMLQVNIPSLSWGEIIYAFKLVCDVKFSNRVSRIIGSLLGKALIKHAAKVNSLQKAIQQAREVSKKDSRKKYGSYPSDLYDWFCASVCDTVIDRYEDEGYLEFCRAEWLVNKTSPDWKETHRNKALTFALSEHYRNSLTYGNDIYVEWYEELMGKLKSGTKQEKTFALYSIVHTGLKQEGYAINSNSKLLVFAAEILRHNSMRTIKNDPSVKVFMETNKIK